MHNNPSTTLLINTLAKVFEVFQHEHELYITFPELLDIDDLAGLPKGVTLHSIKAYSDKEFGSDEKSVLECDLTQLNEDDLQALIYDLETIR